MSAQIARERHLCRGGQGPAYLARLFAVSKTATIASCRRIGFTRSKIQTAICSAVGFFEALDLVQAMMVELRQQRREGASTSKKSTTQPLCGSTGPSSAFHPIRMPVHAVAAVRLRDIRQTVRRLEGERLKILIMLGDAEDLVRLHAQPPARMRQAIGDRRAAVFCARVRPVHRLQQRSARRRRPSNRSGSTPACG